MVVVKLHLFVLVVTPAVLLAVKPAVLLAVMVVVKVATVDAKIMMVMRSQM